MDPNELKIIINKSKEIFIACQNLKKGLLLKKLYINSQEVVSLQIKIYIRRFNKRRYLGKDLAISDVALFDKIIGRKLKFY